MSIDQKKIESLAKLLDKYALTEIEFSDESANIRLCKSHAEKSIPIPVQPEPENTSSSQPTNEETDNSTLIQSPMVGTVYLCPSPGTPAFAQVGQTVQKGDVLCLIEAMKMFNKIKADRAGVIKRVLVNNEQSVEFGAALFAIDE